ncbi:hypothetical protein DUNSADRAFT_181 [Dunaliella salina]|uniref:Encoded protein n=1 Tax=Dunaliella salina TaxID=3046 RepID=A0ABQ7FZD3_DUNSA|nr:hypothetical protein DUNSADRAFT_181 [Dunaliella salina]|eukprot:KAF5827713.1 hypothetical protein DUNSADRAFT_181 [Dunaliella salina]
MQPLEITASCDMPSPFQHVDADFRSVFQPCPRTPTNWGTDAPKNWDAGAKMLPMAPHHGHGAEARLAHAACGAEPLAKVERTHSDKQVRAESPFLRTHVSVDLAPPSSVAHFLLNGDSAKNSCYGSSKQSLTKLAGFESNSSPLPMPFNSDFLLGMKHEAGDPWTDPGSQGQDFMLSSLLALRMNFVSIRPPLCLPSRRCHFFPLCTVS